VRYQKFQNAELLRADLVRRGPIKIDIGCVFNHNNFIDRKILKPVEKEFVIDIDMTDYDGVRTCCKGVNICQMCWKFMSVAGKVLYRALSEDFDFKHILWVFSGRRGMHLWVCDAEARRLQNNERDCLIEYLNLIENSTVKRCCVRSGELLPAV